MRQGTAEIDPSPRRTPKGPQPRALWQAAFWVSFPFGILSLGVATPVLPIYSKELGASALQVGGLFSAISLVPIVVRPFLGRAMDRWGRRPFLLLGLAAYAVAMIVFCVARTVALLTLARFVQGSLGYTVSLPAERAFVANLVEAIAGEDVRGASYGLYTFAYFLGAALGPLVGGWLYDNVGHAMPFYLNTGVLVIGALMVAVVLREPRAVGAEASAPPVAGRG